MTSWRIGLRLAVNRSRQCRLRQLTLPIAAALFMLLVLVAAATFAMTLRQDDREAGRTPVISTHPSSSDVLVLDLADEWRGRSIRVVYLEAIGSELDSVLPPGLTQWPAAGASVVSPELDRLCQLNPALASRYAVRQVIGDGGVGTGGELVAYRGVLGGGALSRDGDAILRVEQGTFVGDGPVRRVSRFGNAGPFAAASTPRGPMLGGLFASLLAPAVLVLAIGCSSSSSVRSRRFAILHALGAPSSLIRSVGIVETLALATPGLVLAALAWSLVGPRLTSMPVVGHQVVAGDLSLPWPLLLGGVLLGVGATVVISVVTTARTNRQSSTPRPGAERPTVNRYSVIPLAAAAAVFLAGAVLGGERQADLVIAGVVLTILGMPLVVPALLRRVGVALGAVRPAVGSLVGNAMAWDPARTARPFVGLASILVLMLAGAGYITVAGFAEDYAQFEEGPQAVLVEWGGLEAGDLHRLAAALDGVVVVSFQSTEGAGIHRRLTLGASCPELAPVFGLTCYPAAPYGLSDEGQRAIVSAVGFAGEQGEVTGVDLAAAEDVPATGHTHGSSKESASGSGHAHEQGEGDTRGQALVLGTGSLPSLDERVRTAALTTLPVSSVLSRVLAVAKVSPMVPWIKGGITAGVLALAVACLLSVVGRLVAAREDHRHLLNLGIGSRQYVGLLGGLFAVPYAIVSVVALATGVVVCHLIVRNITPLPWSMIGLSCLLVAAGGAVGTLMVGAGGARTVLVERE